MSEVVALDEITLGECEHGAEEKHRKKWRDTERKIGISYSGYTYAIMYFSCLCFCFDNSGNIHQKVNTSDRYLVIFYYIY